MDGAAWRIEHGETGDMKGLIRPENCADSIELRNRIRFLRGRDP
jgi:hypothetical protein